MAMTNPLPSIEEFIDDELTEADFKIALTKLHAYLTESIGVNAENVAATININTTGSGNAVTGISANGSNLTITKGATFVPQTRTIAGHALNEDITLTAADISDFSQTIMSRDNGSLALGSYVIASPFVTPETAATDASTSVANGAEISGSNLKRVNFSALTNNNRPESDYNRWDTGNALTGRWRNVSGVTLNFTYTYRLANISTSLKAGLFQRIA